MALAVVVLFGRVLLLLSAIGPNPDVSTVATVITVLLVIAAAIVIPMQVIRARSTEQYLWTFRENPSSVLIPAIRDPLGKRDFAPIDESFRPALFYCVVVSRNSIDLWQGGAHPSLALRINAGQVSDVSPSSAQLGSVTYPAIRVTFHDKNHNSRRFSADFFVRKPNRPQRPRPLDEVIAAVDSINSALRG